MLIRYFCMISYFSKKDIEAIERVKRLNIINSISGIKPANLIGTKSAEGNSNLAIFSSVFHLGSNPAMMGMICRPEGEVPRHTLENIKNTEEFTINAIPNNMIVNAHYTSAKFDRNISEFVACNIQEEFIDTFSAPFVKDSPIKMGLLLRELIPIKSNNTLLIVGEIQHLIIKEDLISKEGYLDLEKANVVGIGGLNNYYALEKVKTLPYARVSALPNFD